MSSLTSRSIILVFARLANYAVLILSPVFLVRILTVESYGQYREFVLYTMLAATLLSIYVKSNLLYFLPKDPDKAPIYLTHSFIILFVSTSIGLSVIWLLKDILVEYTSFDYLSLLIAYVFLYVNLDLMEPYWLAKKRSDYVFIYSTSLMIIRVFAIIVTAYYTRSVITVIFVMVSVEAIKFLLLAYYWISSGLIHWGFDRKLALRQINFIAPLAIAGAAFTLSQKFGSVFVASAMGASALAVYTIGVYQIPVISIVRSAVSDVIFPDMVQHNKNNNTDALQIWRRASIVFCFIVYPVVIAFWIYAEKFIVFLFTDEYIGSVPVFKLMLLLMVRQCFEFGTPLRAKSKNKYFLYGSFLALTLNIVLTFSLYDRYALVAPAIAFILADVVMGIYLAGRVMDSYQVSLGQLFLWKSIFKIAFSALLLMPVLLIAQSDEFNSILVTIGGVTVYCISYVLLVRTLNVEEVDLVVNKLGKRLGIKTN